MEIWRLRWAIPRGEEDPMGMTGWYWGWGGDGVEKVIRDLEGFCFMMGT